MIFAWENLVAGAPPKRAMRPEQQTTALAVLAVAPVHIRERRSDGHGNLLCEWQRAIYLTMRQLCRPNGTNLDFSTKL